MTYTATKMIVTETALWAGGDVAFKGLFEDLMPKAFQFIKVKEQRHLKNKPEASLEDFSKAVAKDIGVEWDDLNITQKAKISELASRMLEGPTISQAKLPFRTEF